jgi:hypothetical protein
MASPGPGPLIAPLCFGHRFRGLGEGGIRTRVQAANAREDRCRGRSPPTSSAMSHCVDWSPLYSRQVANSALNQRDQANEETAWTAR